ncbi:hypothetical protein [Arthrobacter sp. ZGTC131]|uniref:hypothetical protein n=1 Tax=Arthrobacter sp. ZGTC131 TaxID=2058898 RepID=UPI000CE48D44|nr:hypothetical protein [Arthrobacter sp. ZGTC131]
MVQGINSGQTLAHGRGGKHWTALADADTKDMVRHGITDEPLVGLEVQCRRTKQTGRIRIPLDRTVRIVKEAGPIAAQRERASP